MGRRKPAFEKKAAASYFQPNVMENRDYMRSESSPGMPFRFRWSASVTLLVVLVVVYALQCINEVYLHSPAEYWLALTGAGLKSGHVWQLLTFQFLHGSLWHLIGNLIGLWFFGRFVEQVLGPRRFLVAYFGAGLVGGILQGILMLLFPLHYGLLLFGASAGVAGMFAIFAMLEGQSEVQLYFILPIRAMNLLLIFGGISLFFTLVPSARDRTAHAAHLGGLLAGIAWVKLGWHRDYVTLPWEGWLARLRHPLRTRQRKRELVRAASVRERPWRNSAADATPELPPDEFISREVDPILDKISQHGIHSLTAHERQILEAARKKMERR
jgi:membrane associated rhomboid family serine protease